MANNSPCGCPATPAAPSPSTEPLDSALQNFLSAAFGSVTKTVVDGQIVWQLPCGLDGGVEGNPRTDGEGLFCYFLRLFADGLNGLQGIPGEPGLPGLNGQSAFSTLAENVPLPDVGVVSITLPLESADWTVAGAYLFVFGLGWVRVDAVEGATVVGTIVTRISGPSDPIAAGSMVVASGVRGPAGPSPFPATTALSMGGFRLVSLGSPLAESDAATKAYVDSLLAGSDWLVGSAAPVAGLGSVGDFYLDVSTAIPYRKTGPATWTVLAFLASGLFGGGVVHRISGPPAGVLGQVDDWAVDASTGILYEKTGATTWQPAVRFRATSSTGLDLTGNANFNGYAAMRMKRPVVTVSGDFREIVPNDVGARLVCTASSGTTNVTLEFTAANFSDGSELEIVQMGTDAVEVFTDPSDPGGPITVHASVAAIGSLYETKAQYSVVHVRRVGSKLIVSGDFQ